MQFRSLVNLQVKRVYLLDSGSDVVHDAHLDRCGPRRGSELSAQLGARGAVERLVHVVREAGIIDVQFGHGQARHTRESIPNEASQRIPVLSRKFLKHDERYPELAGFRYDGRRQKLGLMKERHDVGIVEVTFARGTTHHKHSQPHKARPNVADRLDQAANFRTYAKKQVLIENKEWLDRADRPVRIL